MEKCCIIVVVDSKDVYDIIESLVKVGEIEGREIEQILLLIEVNGLDYSDFALTTIVDKEKFEFKNQDLKHYLVDNGASDEDLGRLLRQARKDGIDFDFIALPDEKKGE